METAPNGSIKAGNTGAEFHSADTKGEHYKGTTLVLAADPKKIRDKVAQAKNEKPSPHTKYKYVPEEGQS